MQGNLDIPLSERGVREAEDLAEELSSRSVHRVFSGFTLPAYQTARIVRRRARGRSVTRREALDEVNLGLWQGLWDIDLRRKHPRAVQRWLLHPASVEPPMGERLDRAYDRLVRGVEEILSTHGRSRVLIVTGLYAYALLVSYFTDRDLSHFWTLFREPKRWELFAV